MRKNSKLIIMILGIAIFLIGCGPSSPDSTMILNDLSDSEIRTRMGTFTLDPEYIDDFKIVSSDLNKDTRIYSATCSLAYKREYSVTLMSLEISYEYMPNEGWTRLGSLSKVNVEDVTFTKEFVSEELSSSIDGEKVHLSDLNRYWILENAICSTLGSPDYDESNYATYFVEVESKSGYEQMNGELELKYKYTIGEDNWQLYSLDVVESSLKLVKGISDTELANSLQYKSLNNIYTDEPNHIQSGIKWEIHDVGEFEFIEIISSEIDSVNYQNIVECKLQLSKDNIVSRGSINALVSYNGREWRLNELSLIDKFEYEVLIPISRTVEEMRLELDDEKFSYKSGYWNNTWRIKTDDIEELTINEHYPTDYGNEMKYLVELKLRDDENFIEGKAIVTYKLNSDTKKWGLIDVERVNEFTQVEFSDEESE